MKLDPIESLEDAMRSIQLAIELLHNVEGQSEDVVRTETHGAHPTEQVLLEELLHIASHEVQGQLAFTLDDIHKVRRRIGLQRSHPSFSQAQFARICRDGWSLSLVKEIAAEQSLDSAAQLKELSDAVRRLHDDWHAIPKLNHSGIESMSQAATPQE